MLRQRCAFSPYLFLLVAKAFSSLIVVVEGQKKLLGVQCSRIGSRVSHLFFADDSIIFSKAKESDCIAIYRILDIYERASGQKINLPKSAITFSPNVKEGDKRTINNLLGLDNAMPYDSYLGLPKVVGQSRKKTFASIKDRVWKRVQGWRRNMFSAGHREVLVKVVLQAVSSYVMSIFRLPMRLFVTSYNLLFSYFGGDRRKGVRR